MGDGSIQMIAEKRAADSQYQMIIKLVEESKRKACPILSV